MEIGIKLIHVSGFCSFFLLLCFAKVQGLLGRAGFERWRVGCSCKGRFVTTGVLEQGSVVAGVSR